MCDIQILFGFFTEGENEKKTWAADIKEIKKKNNENETATKPLPLYTLIANANVSFIILFVSKVTLFFVFKFYQVLPEKQASSKKTKLIDYKNCVLNKNHSYFIFSIMKIGRTVMKTEHYVCIKCVEYFDENCKMVIV